MLDKTSKQVLKLIEDEFCKKDLAYMYYSELFELCSEKFGLSEHDIRGCINYLHEQGYTEDLKNNGFMTKHRANHLEEFKTIDAIKYIESNWIAIIALATSIVALIKSFFF